MLDKGHSYEQLSLVLQQNMATNTVSQREAKDGNKPNAYIDVTQT